MPESATLQARASRLRHILLFTCALQNCLPLLAGALGEWSVFWHATGQAALFKRAFGHRARQFCCARAIHRGLLRGHVSCSRHRRDGIGHGPRIMLEAGSGL